MSNLRQCIRIFNGVRCKFPAARDMELCRVHLSPLDMTPREYLVDFEMGLRLDLAILEAFRDRGTSDLIERLYRETSAMQWEVRDMIQQIEERWAS